jgi:ParB family chromosome partitioning protein
MSASPANSSPAKKNPRRRKAVAGPVGLTADEVIQTDQAIVERMSTAVARRQGKLLGAYKDPFGGTPLFLVVLPLEAVEPTPFQRDPSDAHVKRLMGVVETLGRFLDPIVVVPHEDRYWTPNGNHRLQALRKLGARSVVALLVPDTEIAFKILALNTEKAHNLREKALETIRMARALAATTDRREAEFAFEFEQPAFLTLGVCYEQRPRLSGGAYQPILRRVDSFLDQPLSRALRERERRGRRMLDLDDAVSEVVQKLKDRGLTSPYLKPFVVARVNYTRFSKAAAIDFDEALDRIVGSAAKFNVDRVKQQDVARAGGAGGDDEP